MATMNPFNVGKPTPNAFGAAPKTGGQVTGGSPIVSQPIQPSGPVGGGKPLVSQPIQPSGPVGGGPLVSQPATPSGPVGGGPLVSQPIQSVGLTGNKPQVSQPPMAGTPGPGMAGDKQQLENLGNELFKQYGSDEGAMTQDPRYAQFREMAQRLNAARQQQQIWNDEANKRIAVNGMTPR